MLRRCCCGGKAAADKEEEGDDDDEEDNAEQDVGTENPISPVEGNTNQNNSLPVDKEKLDVSPSLAPGRTGDLHVEVPTDDRSISDVGDDDERGGMVEPPVTPIGKDELALKRHRFFSDLMAVAEAQHEHRVRFDPRGPSFSGESEGDLLGRHGVDLERLVTRLETVTSRLETTLVGLGDLVATPPQEAADSESPEVLSESHRDPTEQEVNASSVTAKRSSLTVAVASAVLLSTTTISSIESGADRSFSPVSPPQSRIMSVAGYRELVAGPLASYLQLSDKIGGDVQQQAGLVKQAFNAQMEFVELASARTEPNQSELVNLLAPTSRCIQAIQELREKNRTSQYFNHLSAISESIPALAWVTIKPAPSPYIKEMSDAGQFYTNRVLKDWKEKDKTHVEWVKAWLETLSELQRYVKQLHTTGLEWVKGGSATTNCIPPPPPGGLPPPPPTLEQLQLGDMDGGADDRSALFAQINQGEKITKGLKKVTSEMQTHKNPSLRSGPAPFKVTTSTSGSPVAPPKPATVKPPVFIQDGKKWRIENHRNNNSLLIDSAEMNHVVYVYGCTESTVTVKGKVNSIFVDSCKKTAILFDSLVSSVEFVNCQSVKMQVLGKVPTISIDKTNGCQIYLSNESMNVEIISSTSTEMNVCVPQPNGDYVEYPIPEQLKTVIKKNGLETTLVENKG